MARLFNTLSIFVYFIHFRILINFDFQTLKPRLNMIQLSNKKRKSNEGNRKFNIEWTFKYFIVECSSKLMCLICREIITNIKEYNCRRHYELKHSSTYNIFTEELRNTKIEELKNGISAEKNIFSKQFIENKTFTRSSCKVAQIIARSSRSFSDGEFVKECIKSICDDICPEKWDVFSKIPLSRMTIQRRIEDMACDLSEQLGELLSRCKYFSIALDESCDVSDTAQLSVFVRVVDENFILTQELAGIASLHGRTTGLIIFDGLRSVLDKLNVQWSKLTSITTDGAPCMLGKENGLVAKVKSHLNSMDIDTSNIDEFHCIIHQEALVARVMKYENVMKYVFNVVNFIRSRALNHREFKTFLEELGSDFNDIPYHTNVRWLSKGTVLLRFVHLRSEIKTFLSEKNMIQLYLMTKTGCLIWLL